MKKSFILASGSPRRRELLSCIVPDFEIKVSDVDETPIEGTPEEICRDLSIRKGMAVFDSLDGEEKAAKIVISSDTSVWFNGVMYNKPTCCSDAKRMLRELSGNTHEVLTGYAVITAADGATFDNRGKAISQIGAGADSQPNVKVNAGVVVTKVTFAKLTDEEIDEYVASKDPLDKAGAYGIQGVFRKHIEGISGNYDAVVGLPCAALYEALKAEELL